MTFEQWQATRKPCSDLRPYSEGDTLEVGYLYSGDRWITESTRDGKPWFYTVIENTCPDSFDLEHVERELYLWCLDAGDFRPLGD